MKNTVKVAKRFYTQKEVYDFLNTLIMKDIKKWKIFTEEDCLGDTRYRVEYYI